MLDNRPSDLYTSDLTCFSARNPWLEITVTGFLVHRTGSRETFVRSFCHDGNVALTVRFCTRSARPRDRRRDFFPSDGVACSKKTRTFAVDVALLAYELEK